MSEQYCQGSYNIKAKFDKLTSYSSLAMLSFVLEQEDPGGLNQGCLGSKRGGVTDAD
jgi:hypothetical protein